MFICGSFGVPYFLTALFKNQEVAVELPRGLLIPRLPIGSQTASGQQHKQVPGIETDLHRFIADEHMA